MLTLAVQQLHPSGLVKRPQANPVSLVEGCLAHGHNAGPVLVPPREPGGVSRHNCLILREPDQHELLELHEVVGVCSVFLRALVVDVREEDGRLEVLLDVPPVLVVLRGDDAALDPTDVGAEVDEEAGPLAERAVPTPRRRADALVLPAHRDERAHLGAEVLAPLHHGSEELPALREADRVVAGLKALQCSQLPTDLLNLLIHISKEAAPLVRGLIVATPCRDAVHEHAWKSPLNRFFDGPNTLRIAT
mmetsp:Transcript_29067/g.69448  ORF Transcript_29067/g.69448 Transcript_29067/m.69448 type:complete len:248 (+) Transcript_29067:293-1036(+)